MTVDGLDSRDAVLSLNAARRGPGMRGSGWTKMVLPLGVDFGGLDTAGTPVGELDMGCIG